MTESRRNERQNEPLKPDDLGSESTPLLVPKVSNTSFFGRTKSKFRRLTFVKSKSAILVLIWSFFFAVLQWIWSDPSSWIPPLFSLFNYNWTATIFVSVVSVYVYLAILQLFYPLAGYLADVRFGRYKCVIGSLWCFIGSSVSFIGIAAGIATVLLVTYTSIDTNHVPWFNYTIFYVTILVIFVPCVLIGMFLFFSSIVAFNANVIQFGLDQLHDSPSEHLVLYIHWFVVLSYAGSELMEASATPLSSTCITTEPTGNLWLILLSFVCFILIATFFCLLISLCVAARKRRVWFLEDTGSKNPYGLVYRVISFARKHRSPIQRSAFTYCEDELPSRLDLGKDKYGGPFTTEQVEDVKVFLGILKVLLTLGPFFAVVGPNSILLPYIYAHLSQKSTMQYPCSLSTNVLPSVVIIILLIFYIVLLRPFVQQYVPAILKRVGLGMVLMLMPSLCFFILDIVHHRVSRFSPCFLTEFSDPNFSSEYSSRLYIPSFLESNFDEFETSFVTKMPYLLVIPHFLSISGSMIFHIAIYEFIYCQSPHSMKGLMFGTFFAIRGVFQLLGALVFLFPFLGWKLSSSSFPSCGFVFYLVTMVVALIGMIAYIYVTKKYRNRERDEPDNIYRYAEDYYANTQDEPNYDYDDYDNLNVHTNN